MGRCSVLGCKSDSERKLPDLSFNSNVMMKPSRLRATKPQAVAACQQQRQQCFEFKKLGTDLTANSKVDNKTETAVVPATQNSTETAPSLVNATTIPEKLANKTENAPVKPAPESEKNGTKPEEKTEKTPEASTKPNETKVDPKPDASKAKTSNETKPVTDKDAGSQTTVKPEPTTKSTEAPKDSTEKPALVTARGFDGPSFFGGIVLTLGLLAIGFMGFKYYKNQTERNYHTL